MANGLTLTLLVSGARVCRICHDVATRVSSANSAIYDIYIGTCAQAATKTCVIGTNKTPCSDVDKSFVNLFLCGRDIEDTLVDNVSVREN